MVSPTRRGGGGVGAQRESGFLKMVGTESACIGMWDYIFWHLDVIDQ